MISLRFQAEPFIEVDDDQRYSELLEFGDRLFGVFLFVILLLPRRSTASAPLKDRHAVVIRHDHQRSLSEPCRPVICRHRSGFLAED